jgi:hypothetical protein
MSKKSFIGSLVGFLVFLTLVQTQSAFAQSPNENELYELKRQVQALRAQMKEESARKKQNTEKTKLINQIQRLKDSLRVIRSGQTINEPTRISITSKMKGKLRRNETKLGERFKSRNKKSGGGIIWPRPNSDVYKPYSNTTVSEPKQREFGKPSAEPDKKINVRPAPHYQKVQNKNKRYKHNPQSNATDQNDGSFKMRPLNGFQVQRIKSAKPDEKLNGSFGNAYGTTVVDSDPYYLINLSPEMAFGRIGLGFDVDLRLSKDGELRQEDWRDINDALRKIKYVTYTSRDKKFRARVGALHNVTLGTGNLVHEYRNDASQDDSKTGFRVVYENRAFKVDAFTSSLSDLEIVAGRLEINPMNDAYHEILKSFQLGVTYAGDFSPYANMFSKDRDTLNGAFNKSTAIARSSFSGYSFETSLRLLHLPYLDLDGSFDATFLDGYGSGSSFGLKALLKDYRQEFIFNLEVRHIMQSNRYETGYFGPFYEVERFNFINKEEEWLESKANALYAKKSDGNKYRTKLTIDYKNRFKLALNFEKGYDNVADGVLNASLRINNFLPQVNVEAGYIKKNLNKANSLSDLDENTLLSAKAELDLMENLTLSSILQWTFTPNQRKGNKVLSYKTEQWIEPKVNFRLGF